MVATVWIVLRLCAATCQLIGLPRGIEMLLRRASLFRGRLARSLGSWAGEFEAARGAKLEVRQALGSKLEDVWELDQDEEEARAMEAEAGSSAGTQLTFVLSVEKTAVGIIRAALMPSSAGGKPVGLLIGAQVDPALSLSSIGVPLVRAARNELKVRGCERVMAVAPLSGLCEWVASTSAWERLDRAAADFAEEQPDAVEAVAKGVPRAGHSVLGVGTYKAARPAFERLAMEYATRMLDDPDAEAAMYGSNGGALTGVNWMHATDEDALRDCAGCTVSLRLD